MSLSSSVSADGKTVTMSISGRFEFSDHTAFRQGYNLVSPASSNYILDMSRVDYMDSAALGMLVVLHERTGKNKNKIVLKGCSPEILQIIEISKFDQLITIES
jgi:anti-anti-sigma factor